MNAGAKRVEIISPLFKNIAENEVAVEKDTKVFTKELRANDKRRFRYKGMVYTFS